MTSASTDEPETKPETTFRLMYLSHNRIPEDDRKVQLGALFSVARSNNKKLGITGALVLTDDSFVQVLEGDEASVRDLFGRIESDSRHDSVAVLEADVVSDRVFSRWAMARVSEDGEPDIPLIARTDGVTPAASRGTTADQDRVLEVMREAARSGARPTS